MSNPPHIAIIGAGLTGLALALTLTQPVSRFSTTTSPTPTHTPLEVTIYDQSPTRTRFAGAIMLSPNGLSILSRLSPSLYSTLLQTAHSFKTVDYLSPDYSVTDQQILGDEEMFGFDALRIYRNDLRNTMEAEVNTRGIEVEYGCKAVSVNSTHTTSAGTQVSFANGSTITADLIIAADGIHSAIRPLVFPPNSNTPTEPTYQSVLVVCGTVNSSSLSLPSSLPVITGPISQSSPSGGAFLLAPQTNSGSELLAGTQRPFPAQTREGWKRIAEDKTFQLQFLREGMADRSELMQSAINNIEPESLYIWPLHTVPTLPRWWGMEGGVVMVGDAAHAIPPTSGQGANQGFEDAWSLGLIIRHFVGGSAGGDGGAAGRKSSEEKNDGDGDGDGDGDSGSSSGSSKAFSGTKWEAALKWWFEMRKAKIEKLVDLTRRLNNRRLSEEERVKREVKEEDVWSGSGGVEGVRWLFGESAEGVEERVRALLEENK